MQWCKREKETIKPGACEVCGYLTLNDNKRNLFDICPVCFWEDDEFHNDPDEPCDVNNNISLNQARENYKRYGACDPTMVKNVRKPLPEEIPVE